MEREYRHAERVIHKFLRVGTRQAAGGARNYFQRATNKISPKITTGIIRSMV